MDYVAGIDGMKSIYVWRDFMPDWESGLAVAVADSLEEAIALVEKDYGYKCYCGDDCSVIPLDDSFEGFAACVGGGS